MTTLVAIVLATALSSPQPQTPEGTHLCTHAATHAERRVYIRFLYPAALRWRYT
jgi:hypothetical protein